MAFRRPLFAVLALTPTLLVLVAARGDPAPAGRAWVLDSGARNLVLVDLVHGQRLAVLGLRGAPEFLLQSPDGSRLVVLDRGSGDDRGSRGYRAASKSVATIVDSTHRVIVARVELGSGVDVRSSYFSPDGHLTLLCPGFESKNPSKALAREVVRIDSAAGRETGRLTLDYGTVPLLPARDARTLPLIQGLPRGAQFPFPRGRLWLVDLSGPSVTGTVATGTWTKVDGDGTYLYLLDSGRPDNDPHQDRNGSVQVVSLESATVEAILDAGRNPRGLHRDEQGGQMLIASDGPLGAQGAAGGELRAFRGSRLVATLKVASNPRLVVRKADTVYVVGESAVTLVDPFVLQVTATIPLSRGPGVVLDDDDVPTGLEVGPDGRRAFVHYGFHNKVAVLDPETRSVIGSIETGRGSRKLLRNLAHVLDFAALVTPPPWGDALSVADAAASAVGYSPQAKVTPKMLVLRPDGRFGYAINRQTRDVTVVDAATATTAAIVGGGGYELRPLAGGHVLAVLSWSGLLLLDTDHNKKLDKIDVPELRSFKSSPNGAYVVALGRKSMICSEGSTGKVLAQVRGFVNAVGFAFDDGVDDGGY